MKLTKRQTQVLREIAKGHTLEQGAANIGIGVKTFEDHRYAISHKLKLSGSVNLAVYAFTHGIAKLPSAMA